jgi:hypothetical protein
MSVPFPANKAIVAGHDKPTPSHGQADGEFVQTYCSKRHCDRPDIAGLLTGQIDAGFG